MRKFILTHEKYEGEVTVAFKTRGVTAYVDFRGCEAGFKLTHDILKAMPVDAQFMKEWAEENAFALVEVKQEPTFEEFWKLWPEVKANKARALTHWKKLSKKDKQRVIEVQHAYARYVQRHPTKYAKYPDIWLSERKFDNDYNTM